MESEALQRDHIVCGINDDENGRWKYDENEDALRAILDADLERIGNDWGVKRGVESSRNISPLLTGKEWKLAQSTQLDLGRWSFWR